MSSGLDWERFGVITGGDEVCILPPPLLSEKGLGIPTCVHFPIINKDMLHLVNIDSSSSELQQRTRRALCYIYIF